MTWSTAQVNVSYLLCCSLSASSCYHKKEASPVRRLPQVAIASSTPSGAMSSGSSSSSSTASCTNSQLIDDETHALPDGMRCWLGCEEIVRDDSFSRDDLRSALGDVDVGSCIDGAGVHGYATIVVVPSGHVDEVTLRELDPSQDDVAECVKSKYMMVRIRSFGGAGAIVNYRF